MKALKIALIALAISLLLQVRVKAQEWQAQFVQIPTRWAKQVKINNPLPEYPRPQLQRENWQNLNGLWEYSLTASTAKKFGNTDGKILVPYPIESSLSGVKKQLMPNQLLWYKRQFLKPLLKPDDRALLHFGAVDWQAKVYINGVKVGEHTGGYTSFSYDITDALKNGKNELVVSVYDPTDKGIGPHGKQALNPANIYYTSSSGIWQTVWIETVPASYIESLTITPDLDRSVVNVTVNSDVDVDVELKVAGKTFDVKSNTVFSVPMNNIRVWTPDDPYLYDLIVTLGEDEVKSYFAMRKISIGKDEKGFDRILLNNTYTYNLGTLDQGFWPDGLYTAPTDEALAFDIKAIKAMGFNTIRKHIKIEPARWYHHADRLGMMVWQDLVNPNASLPAGSKQQFEKECADIVEQLHNYPSITTWVLFNEKWGQYDQERLTKWLKQTDPSRIVNGHSGEFLYVNRQLRSPSLNPYVGADMTDVHSYPNPMMPIRKPGKAQVLGEFGGIGVPVEGHLLEDLKAGWGYNGLLTPTILKTQYSLMVDSLIELEKQGLSASIYTQPFDVETELNGFITYDRQVLKLPLNELRDINSKLWPPTKKSRLMEMEISVSLPDTPTSYLSRVSEFKSGRRDSIFLRRLAILALNSNDLGVANYVAAEYLKHLVNPLEESNLKFIIKFALSTSDLNFKFLLNNVSKVNGVLGKDVAEAKITSVIEKSEIAPLISANGGPNWEAIYLRVKGFGNSGEEIYLQTQFLYAVNNSDWELFKLVAKRWFRKYGSRRKWITDKLLNNAAWAAFEQSSDNQVLEVAAELCSKNIDQAEPNRLDTYANLLYKLGKNETAVQMEEKAVMLSNNDPRFLETLIKMKKGIPTWDVTKQVK